MSALPYSLTLLYRDRHRFLPALLAVAFSAVLIAIQCGLVLGVIQCVAVQIQGSRADIWVLTRDAESLAQAYPIPEHWRLRVAAQPEVVLSETYLIGAGAWHKPEKASSESCYVIGTQVDEDSLGIIQAIPAEMRAKLREPGTIVVDEWDLENLGLRHGVGETAEINQQRVRVVGTVRGFRGHNFIFAFCSLQTARQILPTFHPNSNLTMCVLARCHDPEQVPLVIQRLNQEYPDMGVYTRAELARKVQVYWLFRSAAGTVMLCTVTLALLVGLVVTGQTLSASVLASLREYAVLDALGISRWRLIGLVLAKSLWIGLGGVLVALPVVYALSGLAFLVHTHVVMPPQLVLITALLTLGMALVSGLSALRSLRLIEPATLLR